MIHRHYPTLISVDEPYLALLNAVIERQAELVAKWQLVGFIHGVMNVDNMSIAGEIIDYGSCAFMGTYHPETVYSSIYHMVRYAYQNQPPIAHWNLADLVYSKAVEGTYLELEEEIKHSLIFKRDEDYSIGIRQYCCNKIRAAKFNTYSCLLMEFGVFKGESINFFAKQC